MREIREIITVHIEGQRYGVWKDEVECVRKIANLHRLPLSPACIAGISIIDDRTVTLADLPVCIGRPSASGDGRGAILMLSGGAKISGFVVHDDIDSASLSPDALMPMPAYLTTPVMDTCALHGTTLIPVINLHKLGQQLLTSAHGRPVASNPVRTESSRRPAAKFRIFELAGQLFAADAEDIHSVVDRGAATALADVAACVKGITLHEGEVVPQIDLLQRMDFHAAEHAGKMLIAEIRGAKFGFLIDGDLGAVSLDDVRLLDLPPITCSSWLSEALLHSGEVVPVVDLAALFSEQNEPRPEPLEQRYHPDSVF